MHKILQNEIRNNLITYLKEISKQLNIQEQSLISNCENLYIPYCMQLKEMHEKLHRPIINGVLGVQGVGKTTFGKICGKIFELLGVDFLSLSIDDYYKSYDDRKILYQLDSRIKYRGPPVVQLFEQIIKSKDGPIKVMQFDKSLHGGEGDQIEPLIVERIPQIVIFEGWMCGIQPIQDVQVFNEYFKQKEQIQFAIDMNKKLQEYQEIFQFFDYFLIIKPEKYSYSIEWRKEQERNMIKIKNIGKTDDQIDEFVNYFWNALHPQIFIDNLLKNHPDKINQILILDQYRNLIQNIRF